MAISENIQNLENKRRTARFALRNQKNFWALVLLALLIALVSHLAVIWFFQETGYGMSLSPVVGQLPPDVPEKELRPIVLQSDESAEKDPPPEELPEAIPDNEPLEDMSLPEPIDMEVEAIKVQPGASDIGLDNEDSMEVQDSVISQIDQIVDDIGAASSAEPAPSDDLLPTSNPDYVIRSLGSDKDIDPDQWNRENLNGGTGNDDQNVPGVTSFKDLLAQPSNSLGKNSGHGVIGADLLFEYNQSRMKQSARIGLLQLASLICKNPKTYFIIEGHTDSFGSKEYNRILSLRRANAVRTWLLEHGIDLSRVYIRACGCERPVVSTSGDKKAQAPNRRVEIHMRKEGEEMPPDVLSVSYKVDMDTPISQQLRQERRSGTSRSSTSSSSVPSLPGSSRVKDRRGSVPGSVRNVVPSQSSNASRVSDNRVRDGVKQNDLPLRDLEDIPAQQVNGGNIPVAEPLPEEDIPVAEPIPENQPNGSGKKSGTEPLEPGFMDPLLP